MEHDGQGRQIFVNEFVTEFNNELTRFAVRIADERVYAVAERAAAPLRVAVTGRPGVGCRTVARALGHAGGPAGLAVTHRCDGAELLLYLIAEVPKPEDGAALAGAGERPLLAVLNKADLTGLSGAGPPAAAATRCAELSRRVCRPILPLSGLLAGAASRGLDGVLWAALQELAAGPGAACLDGSFEGFLTAPLPVPVEVRRRLLNTLDLFGIALGIAAVQQGRDAQQFRVLLRRVSGVDAVLDRLVALGAAVRYRRVLDAVADLEALAVSHQNLAEPVAAFLSHADTVTARMAVAEDAARESGLTAGLAVPAGGHLARAAHWRRYGRSRVSDLHRSCAGDIARGSLRLWARAEEAR